MPLTVNKRLRLTLAAALVVAMGSGVTGAAIAAPVNPNVITRSGSTLMLHGHAYRFTGVNAYELGTYWSVNAGCGQQLSDVQLDAFFAGLRPDSVVRFWAFQAQGVNKATHKIDFTGLDRVFRAAERHGQRLLPVLGNQDGSCDDGHWRDAAWYSGAYTKKFNDDRRGLNVLPYSSWVSSVVTRYRSSPALGMWEPLNEPEAANCAAGFLGNACYAHKICPATAATTLRLFFNSVGAQIKRLDPTHLIASGVIGGSQCGINQGDFSTVHGSSYLDVATYHDYGNDAVAVPGDAWTGMLVRLDQARALSKPLITEEVGIVSASDSASGCTSRDARAALLTDKLTAQLSAGSRGFLVWNLTPQSTAGCTYDLDATDPMMSVLRTAPV
ncbi:MAG: mannan endo,4-beta-mannosidase [Actinomycetota bacterium]|jgi:hypothetical protein|nr:mannan endo,4-beta-mannosidase [Actinomycetota bacterium]